VADRNHPKSLNEGANLELRTNVFLGTTEMGEAILRYLFKVGSPFAPELFDGGKLTGGRKTKFDDSDLTLPLRVWTHDR